MTTGRTSSAEEDCVIWQKAPEQLLKDLVVRLSCEHKGSTNIPEGICMVFHLCHLFFLGHSTGAEKTLSKCITNFNWISRKFAKQNANECLFPSIKPLQKKRAQQNDVVKWAPIKHQMVENNLQIMIFAIYVCFMHACNLIQPPPQTWCFRLLTFFVSSVDIQVTCTSLFIH